VVNVGGGVQAHTAVAMVVVVLGEKIWQCCRVAWIEAKWSGKSGRYFML
jgi:hypothetical protein